MTESLCQQLQVYSVISWNTMSKQHVASCGIRSFLSAPSLLKMQIKPRTRISCVLGFGPKSEALK